MAKLVMKYGDISGLAVPYLVAKEYPEYCKDGLIYTDNWPFQSPVVLVFHPDICAQFTQETSLPKAPFYRTEFYPLTQCKDLVSTEGMEWKTWRSVFNPGFSSKNLTAHLPGFLEDIDVLKERLLEFARSGEVLKLEKVVQKGTVDIICRAVL